MISIVECQGSSSSNIVLCHRLLTIILFELNGKIWASMLLNITLAYSFTVSIECVQGRVNSCNPGRMSNVYFIILSSSYIKGGTPTVTQLLVLPPVRAFSQRAIVVRVLGAKALPPGTRWCEGTTVALSNR